MIHFLLVYNNKRGKLVKLDEFGQDTHRATDAYAEEEKAYRDRPDRDAFEIVLVGADSLDTLQVTHSRYFRESELVPFS